MDAFGFEDKSLCCLCCENDLKGCMLPKNRNDDVLLLSQSGQGRVITPPIMKGGPCCKGVQRWGCTVCKFAFPCDQEVPMVLAVCDQKLFARNINGGFEFGDNKPINPATGKKPIFSKIVTRGAMSVKEPKMEAMSRD